MNKKIAIFGSTGSIGTQSLDVITRLGGYEVVFLAAGGQWEKLAEQANNWKPKVISIANEKYIKPLRQRLTYDDVEILHGPKGMVDAASNIDFDICVNGLVGVAGLLPSYHVLLRGIDLALANKESLVLGGDLLNKIADQTDAQIIPVDSEHSAILQCLQGENKAEVKKLILTASGGPFRTWDVNDIYNATPEDALKHPTWRMGAKITIDSATLMNKGLEIIEAYHLFGIPPEKIEAVIHPVSIVHSMIEFVDGSFKAQLGMPDMRLPIQHALTFPHHEPLHIGDDHPTKWKALEFFPIEYERYPCLKLAFQVLKTGGTSAAVLNGADEAAVMAFLEGNIKFGHIYELIQDALDEYQAEDADAIERIINADHWGRMFVHNAVHS